MARGTTGLRFGSLDLGSTGYNTSGGDITFGQNGKPKRTLIDWDAAARTLTITLGDESAVASTVSGPSTFTYTPDPLVTNSSTVPIGGTLSGTGVLF